MRPKLYILVIIGYSKGGKLEVVYHIRSKGIREKRDRELTVEDFEEMLHNNKQIPDEEHRFVKAFKKTNEPAIKSVVVKKK